MYDLAAYFREWDVPGWLARISWRQLQLWLQFREVQPFGEEREDLRAGQVVAALYNVNQADKKAKVWSASDAVRMLEPSVQLERAKGSKGAGPADPATEEARWLEYKASTKAAVKAAFGSRDRKPRRPPTAAARRSINSETA